jgi:hypothetical protein
MPASHPDNPELTQDCVRLPDVSSTNPGRLPGMRDQKVSDVDVVVPQLARIQDDGQMATSFPVVCKIAAATPGPAGSR